MRSVIGWGYKISEREVLLDVTHPRGGSWKFGVVIEMPIREMIRYVENTVSVDPQEWKWEVDYAGPERAFTITAYGRPKGRVLRSVGGASGSETAP